MKIKSKKLFIILLFAVYCSLFIALDVQAEYTLEEDYPAIQGTVPTGELTNYIRYIYLFGLSLVGIAALGGLVYGGFVYMLSGTVTSKDEAKKWIWGAISGLILALAAWLILNTINPDLLKLKEPTLPEVNIPESTPGPGPPGSLTCEPGNCDAGCEAAASCAEPTYFWDNSFCECVYYATGP